MPTEIFRLPKFRSRNAPCANWSNQLGEAVVQVRAPSGLGSGFILNEDGYLITNFM